MIGADQEPGRHIFRILVQRRDGGEWVEVHEHRGLAPSALDRFVACFAAAIPHRLPGDVDGD